MDRGEILEFLVRAEELVARTDKLLAKRREIAGILFRSGLDTAEASGLLRSVEQTLSELIAHRDHFIEELARLDFADWLNTVSTDASEDDAPAGSAGSLRSPATPMPSLPDDDNPVTTSSPLKGSW
jgi:hypothetical protein